MLPSILNAGRGEGIVKAAETFLLGTRENGERFRQKALIQDDGGGRARQKKEKTSGISLDWSAKLLNQD